MLHEILQSPPCRSAVQDLFYDCESTFSLFLNCCTQSRLGSKRVSAIRMTQENHHFVERGNVEV